MAVEAPTLAQPALRRARWRRREQLGTAGLLSPPVVWLAFFFLVPVAFVGVYSFGVLSLVAEQQGFSVAAWREFFGDSIYLSLFWKSIRISLIVSGGAVLLAYPIAYFLALVAGGRKYPLLLLILIPFLTSYLLRVLAWKVILGDQGVVNSALFETGLRDPDHPVTWLLYSQFTVMLVLGYVWIPFVALPIFVTLENLDRSLLEAASDLGASRWQAFRRITLPLSLPGVIAAFLFVFIPTIGEFITPSLVGGTRGFLYGNAIADLFLAALDWRTGSVLALFMLAVVAALAAVFARFLQTRRLAT